MSTLFRIEIEFGGAKIVLEGDAEKVLSIAKDPSQIKPLLNEINAKKTNSIEKHSDVIASQDQPSDSKYTRWLESKSISNSEIDQVFHITASGIDIIAEINEKTSSKKQISLALLLGVKHYNQNGEAKIPKDELVELCQSHSCYDSKNFMRHMKNRNTLFGPFKKEDNIWLLSVPGLAEAAALIKLLTTKGK